MKSKARRWSSACAARSTAAIALAAMGLTQAHTRAAYVAVDLHPTGFATSDAHGVSGTQQVGRGWGSTTSSNTKALLWNGTAASAVNLNPSDFASSTAWGASGTQQVGYGIVAASGFTHALRWS